MSRNYSSHLCSLQHALNAKINFKCLINKDLQNNITLIQRELYHILWVKSTNMTYGVSVSSCKLPLLAADGKYIRKVILNSC